MAGQITELLLVAAPSAAELNFFPVLGPFLSPLKLQPACLANLGRKAVLCLGYAHNFSVKPRTDQHIHRAHQAIRMRDCRHFPSGTRALRTRSWCAGLAMPRA
ncbi:unannotated protein [freshwater metagenome]|uniref:Unannotated protein n=1 Tax=freshwater metagenome TaxID=449393 RepID=A0A6J6KPT2_9ZZZZ